MIVQICLRERGLGACQLEATAEKITQTQGLQWNPSGSEEPDGRELPGVPALGRVVVFLVH